MEDTKTQAELMAALTFDLNKTCHEKEHHFAAAYNLTTAEFRCLRFFRNKERLPIKDLCNYMKLSPGRITHILTSLEDKKLITREMNREDRRGINVALTEKSLPFIKSLNDSYVKFHADILSGIERDKREAILTAMDELVKALKNWSDNK